MGYICGFTNYLSLLMMEVGEGEGRVEVNLKFLKIVV
jgi:hypothetical protein